ncbi:MAG: acyltransferase, partial [Cyanobacteria bacterium J06598_1]
QNLFLVQTWTVPTQFSWNAIAWAVSNEWLAYLTFPIIIGITLRIRSVPAVLGSIFVLLWGMTAACLLINNSLEMAGGAGSYGLLRVAGEFVAGCLMYNLYSIQWGKQWNWSLLTSLSWLAALIGSAAFISYGMSNAGATIGTAVSKLSSSSFQIQVLSLTPLYAFAIYALAWQRGPLAQLFSTRLMMLGGHLSYSLYLTHYICLIVLRRVLPVESVADGNIAVRFLVLLIYLVIMLAAAAVTYRFVEEPGRLWMKARFKRKRDIRVGNYR